MDTEERTRTGVGRKRRMNTERRKITGERGRDEKMVNYEELVKNEVEGMMEEGQRLVKDGEESGRG